MQQKNGETIGNPAPRHTNAVQRSLAKNKIPTILQPPILQISLCATSGSSQDSTLG
jgi:hypothetical protein